MNNPFESAPSIKVSGDASAISLSLTHFWSFCVGAGRANEGLRAGWQEQLRLAKEHCGFRFCRFHGLFHDDMFVYREVGERVAPNFQYVDELFDRMLAMGVRPFVEFGFCPKALARQHATVFWWGAHGSPPKDYAKWGELLRLSASHWVERYGLEEVRKWYFEIWNEPNLHPFFKGTKSEYFELYKTSVRAIKSVDSSLRVGGPATSNFVPDTRFAGETEDFTKHELVVKSKDIDSLDWKPVWLIDFLTYCKQEDLPVDFISTHPYPTDWALDSHGQQVKQTREVRATRKDLALLRKIIDQSFYPHAEIHLTEWSSSPSSRDFTHDYPQAATYIAKINLESIGLVDSLSYWTFTDVFEEEGAGDGAFHGGFGMLNYRGVPKPSFHAYRFLNNLGDELIGQSPGAIVTKHRVTGKLTALAYHYPPTVGQSIPASADSNAVAEATMAIGSEQALEVHLTGLTPNCVVIFETLDRMHGNAVAAWRAMGSPPSPTIAQLDELNRAAWATKREVFRANESGELLTTQMLQPWAIVLIRQL
jgi:xylan 1,4-beta-xylosidase